MSSTNEQRTLEGFLLWAKALAHAANSAYRTLGGRILPAKKISPSRNKITA